MSLKNYATFFICFFLAVQIIGRAAGASGDARCLSNQFRCSITGVCIDNSKRCDSTYDCDDFSDELNCQQLKVCTDNEFHCANGYCISNRYVCDLDNDCGDNSDETSCDNNSKAAVDQKSGSFEQQQQPTNNQPMAPLTAGACGVEFFQCPPSGDEAFRCIPFTAVCNGQPDCFDASDEWNCTTMMARAMPPPSASNGGGGLGMAPSPQYNGFQPGGFTGPYGLQNKLKSNSKPPLSDDRRGATAPIGASCPAGKLLCRSGRQCIEETKRCDFYADCDDGSDEEYCGAPDSKRCQESENSFLCANGFCVDRRFTCDSINDCGDMSDEQNCGGAISLNSGSMAGQGSPIEKVVMPPTTMLNPETTTPATTTPQLVTSPTTLPTTAAPTTTTPMQTTTSASTTNSQPSYKLDNLAALLAAAITSNRQGGINGSDPSAAWSSLQSLMNSQNSKSNSKTAQRPVEKVMPKTTPQPQQLHQQKPKVLEMPISNKANLMQEDTIDYGADMVATAPPGVQSSPVAGSGLFSSPPPSFIFSASEQLYTQLACENEMLALSCPDGYVIGLFSVLFGRDDTTSCMKSMMQMLQPASLNCRSNSASDIVKTMCEAKQSCQVRAAISLFGDPCIATPKYLRVRFGCRPVVYANSPIVMADPILEMGPNGKPSLTKSKTSSKLATNAVANTNAAKISSKPSLNSLLVPAIPANPWAHLLRKLSSNDLSNGGAENIENLEQISDHKQTMDLRDLKAAQWEVHPTACPTQPVREWLHQHVSKWLECHGLGQYKSLFNANDLFGLDLLSLDKNDLERVGVNRIGHQKRLMRAITRLRLLDASRNNSLAAWMALSQQPPPSKTFAMSQQHTQMQQNFGSMEFEEQQQQAPNGFIPSSHGALDLEEAFETSNNAEQSGMTGAAGQQNLSKRSVV